MLSNFPKSFKVPKDFKDFKAPKALNRRLTVDG